MFLCYLWSTFVFNLFTVYSKMQCENAFIYVCVDKVDCLQHIRTNYDQLISRWKVGMYKFCALFVVRIVYICVGSEKFTVKLYCSMSPKCSMKFIVPHQSSVFLCNCKMIFPFLIGFNLFKSNSNNIYHLL